MHHVLQPGYFTGRCSACASWLNHVGHTAADVCPFHLSSILLSLYGLLLPAAQLQLESCDITGCRNLAAFSSSSPSLRELTASACGRLYSLTLASTALQALQLANCSQLSQVHVAAAGAAPAPGKRAAGSSSKGRAVAVEAGPRVALRGLNVNGCLNLSADAKARLAAAVASRQ